MNASEPVRPDTMERFLARFAAAGLSPDALVASYGLAENTLCASSGGRTHVRVSQRRQRSQDLPQLHGAQLAGSTGAVAVFAEPQLRLHRR